MVKYNAVFLICIILYGNVFAQNSQRTKFVVITYEDNYSKSLHGNQRYFWVIETDSIKSFKSLLYPLYLSNYSQTHLSNCVSGKSIDPAIPTLKPGDHDFDSLWLDSHEKLEKLIYVRRKLIQTIQKKWSSGNKETITIYATPIIGEFYSCQLLLTGQPPYPYKGRIFLAGNFVKNDDQFWKSALANFILKQDFSNLNFKRSYF